MRDQNADWDDSYDYSPNELAELSQRDPKKYNRMVSSNLSDEDSVDRWEQRNLQRARDYLAHQKANRR